MMTFILIIHSLVCVLLLLAILMQAGRGGGLTEQFSSAETVFGAQTNELMVRITSVLATIFFVTCLSLAFMSARQERSLVAEHLPARKAATAPVIPADTQNAAPAENAAPAAEAQPAAPAEPAPAVSETSAPAPTNAQ
jgi:preprotein translocase subunit SecG